MRQCAVRCQTCDQALVRSLGRQVKRAHYVSASNYVCHDCVGQMDGERAPHHSTTCEMCEDGNMRARTHAPNLRAIISSWLIYINIS